MTGDSNTATGANALQNITTGHNNTATGAFALGDNSTGSYNTAIGRAALLSYSGSQNTAIGEGALSSNSGNDNVAVGFLAGAHGSTGSNNIYLGSNVQGMNESDVIRLGLQGTQTKTIIAGIRGITTGAATRYRCLSIRSASSAPRTHRGA